MQFPLPGKKILSANDSSGEAHFSFVVPKNPGIYFGPIESSLVCPGGGFECFQPIMFVRFRI
jgi:hypothetical protein